MLSPTWNPALEGLRCPLCCTLYPVMLRHTGCEACAAKGRYVSLTASYSAPPDGRVRQPFLERGSLGEGSTPVVDLQPLADSIGVAGLAVKEESRNPSGSHKDRMSALGIAHALAAGADTVILASSGNAALSAATYCAAAGLKCEVAGYADMPPAYVRALEHFGARRIGFETGFERWAHVERRARSAGVLALTNFVQPAVGSAPIAIEGYKLVAQEIADSGWMPDHVVVPTSRGDLIWGIHRGFLELKQARAIRATPKLWAAEPYERLTRVLQGACLHDEFPGITEQFSTAGSTVTWLQCEAATASGGGAMAVSDEAARRARAVLRRYGITPELCGAATLAATQSLVARGRIARSEHVMLVVTASAMRDPSWPDPPQ